MTKEFSSEPLEQSATHSLESPYNVHRAGKWRDEEYAAAASTLVPFFRRLAHGSSDAIGLEDYRLACIPLGLRPEQSIPKWFVEFAEVIRPICANLVDAPLVRPSSIEATIKGFTRPEYDANFVYLVGVFLIQFAEGKLDCKELKKKPIFKAKLEHFVRLGEDLYVRQFDGVVEAWFCNEKFRLAPDQWSLLYETWNSQQRGGVDQPLPDGEVRGTIAISESIQMHQGRHQQRLQSEADQDDLTAALLGQNRLLVEQNAILREELALLRHEQGITQRELHKLMGPDLTLLPKDQQEVLEAIRALPGEAFGEADALIGKLEGQPMTKMFVRSFSELIRGMEWGVVCSKPGCGAPATLIWHPGERYAEGGRAHYSHSTGSGSSVSHGSLTTIRSLHFCKRLDRRRRP